jgi:glycosyltransferase involved in cell wall biosynthesis
VGGVESIIGHQAERLTARGHRVTVLAGRGGQFRADIEFQRIEALDSKHPLLLEVNRGLGDGHVPIAFEKLARELQTTLQRVLPRLDVCVVHNALTLHFNLPLTAALHRIAEKPSCGLVAWCHDLSWSNPLYRPAMREAYPWSLLKVQARGAAYVLVSEDRRGDFADLAGVPSDSLIVIPAGVDLKERLGLAAATMKLLSHFSLLEVEPFILLPVRITRRKNIECAIRVTAELRELGLRPKLLVTGPRGPHDPASTRYVRELQSLREQLSLGEEVFLLQTERSPNGRFWRPTDRVMADLYRAADLMILPSAQEGFGIPLLEAGAAGLPVFCSDIPPFREIGHDSVEFFQLDEAPREIAKRIAWMLAADDRHRLRRRVKREYDWDSIFDEQVVPLLNSVSKRGLVLG